MAALGLEGAKVEAKPEEDEVMARRRALFANIKKGMAEDN